MPRCLYLIWSEIMDGVLQSTFTPMRNDKTVLLLCNRNCTTTSSRRLAMLFSCSFREGFSLEFDFNSYNIWRRISFFINLFIENCHPLLLFTICPMHIQFSGINDTIVLVLQQFQLGLIPSSTFYCFTIQTFNRIPTYFHRIHINYLKWWL